MHEQARYAWPASKLAERDMFLVWRARERSPHKTTISALIAAAVRQVYGDLAIAPRDMPQTEQERLAA